MKRIIFVIVLLLAVLLLFFYFSARHNKLERERFIRTHNGLPSMGNAIIYSAWQHNGQLPETFDEIIKQLDDTHLRHLKTFYDPTIETGVYRDAWGSPVHFQKMGDSKYLLISNGPNRKFENGGGDDISYEFYITPSPNVLSSAKTYLTAKVSDLHDPNGPDVLFRKGETRDSHEWRFLKRHKPLSIWLVLLLTSGNVFGHVVSFAVHCVRV